VRGAARSRCTCIRVAASPLFVNNHQRRQETAVATKKAPSKKAPKRSVAKSDRNEAFICNVVPSARTETDWRYEDSVNSGAITAVAALPRSVDLRAPWWTINDQQRTGSCVGWATADGVVRHHMVAAGKIAERQMLSPRHVWMASKETDQFTTRPETFIEESGTSLKAALDVARKHGVALESELPFAIDTTMYLGREQTFYASCAQRKVNYFNLGLDLQQWKRWLASTGPILAAFSVDDGWYAATANGGKVDAFKQSSVVGGHAICVVGYRADGRFIVRNSWGVGFGDKGFAYVKPSYIQAAFFDEAYGVTV
jgi:C1A family cysteine protease